MSRFRLPLAVLLLLPGLGLASARGDEITDRLRAYMDASAEVDDFHGAVIVTRGDETLLSNGYGFANIEHEVPNTPRTKFRLGSITKQFTAMAILILQERGKLNVRDPIREHLDDTPEAWREITIHHLLTHTSGIPSYTGSLDYRVKMRLIYTVDQMIGRFRNSPLEFEPGAEYRYSNSGYFLLGAIIEAASGQSYEDFLRESIFEPLGMGDTGYDHAATILEHRASGYEREGDGLVNAPYLDMSQPYAAGALYSTVEDLATWDRALRAGKLIGPESYEAMFTPFKDDYAYGWQVEDHGGRKEVSHGGGINGFNTHIVRYPEEGVCAVALSNVAPAPVNRIASDLAAIALGEEVRVPRLREVAEIDPAGFDALVGRYRLAPDFILNFTRDGDRFFVEATGQPRAEIFPESATEFFLKIVDAQLTFVKNDDGCVTAVILHQNGHDQKAERLADDAPGADTPPGEEAADES